MNFMLILGLLRGLAEDVLVVGLHADVYGEVEEQGSHGEQDQPVGDRPVDEHARGRADQKRTQRVRHQAVADQRPVDTWVAERDAHERGDEAASQHDHQRQGHGCVGFEQKQEDQQGDHYLSAADTC